MDPIENSFILPSGFSCPHTNPQFQSFSQPAASFMAHAPGPIQPAVILDNNNQINLSTINPLLMLSQHVPVLPVAPPLAPVGFPPAIAAVDAVTPEEFPTQSMPLDAFGGLDYATLLECLPPDAPDTDFTSFLEDNIVSPHQPGALSTMGTGIEMVDVLYMPLSTLPANVLSQLEQPNPNQSMDQLISQPTPNPSSDFFGQPSDAQPGETEIQKLQMAAEMAARFPPELVVHNYTAGIEYDLSVPLNIPEWKDLPKDSEDVSEDDNENGDSDNSLWIHDPKAATRVLARKAETRCAMNRRREEYQKRRARMLKRRRDFIALGERADMYFVQDVRNECRNSGVDDPENQWSDHDFDTELYILRDVGKAAVEDGSAPLDVHAICELNELKIAANDAKNEAYLADSCGYTANRASMDPTQVLKEAEEREAAERLDRFYILVSVPRQLFDIKLVDVNSPELTRPWGYLSLVRKIHESRLRPCLKYFLYKELDRVQCISMRRNNSIGMADRIESLEWDVKDYMKKGEVESAHNIRTVARDYRAGFVRMPQDGGSFLYYEGKLTGYFPTGKLVPFIYSMLKQGGGPIWKEDGNQPRTLPEVYTRALTKLVAEENSEPNYCVHGNLIDGSN
ncbi:hypothetical protein TWF718_003294 [Orbilia javanica]|uniref:Uncharacterized protein n=1 Tax=Orbilia javanica TaxID=47235 RepID=A0AAN8R7R7_9PEZI